LRHQGDTVHHQRVARRLRPRGLETVYPKPRMREPHPTHRVYPSLLRGVPITRVHQVWSTDITYMRLHGGLISLVAVMDWFSRYVLSWAVSSTMDVRLCLEAFDHALEVARPDIFNSDQGAQFTRLDFTGRLAAAGVQIRMDGRGRALDNVVVERRWRTVKYEEVSWKDYETPREAMQG
jgi:putative transposase